MKNDKECIIVIDTWAGTPHDEKDRYFHNIVLFLEKMSMPVFLASHDNKPADKGIVKAIISSHPVLLNNGTGYRVYKNRLGITRTNDVIKPECLYEILVKNHISTINYVGMSLPGCIFHRPIGIENMKNKFDCYAIIDLCYNDVTSGSIEEKIHAQYNFCKLNNINIKYSYDY